MSQLSDVENKTGNFSRPSILSRMFQNSSGKSSVSPTRPPRKDDEGTQRMCEYKEIMEKLRRTHESSTNTALHQMAIGRIAERNLEKRTEASNGKKNLTRLPSLVDDTEKAANVTPPSPSDSVMRHLIGRGGRLFRDFHMNLAKESSLHREISSQSPKQNQSGSFGESPKQVYVLLQRDSNCNLVHLNRTITLNEARGEAGASDVDSGAMRRVVSIVSLGVISEHDDDDYRDCAEGGEDHADSGGYPIKPSVSVAWIKQLDELSPEDLVIVDEGYSGSSLICAWRTNSQLSIADMVTKTKDLNKSVHDKVAGTGEHECSSPATDNIAEDIVVCSQGRIKRGMVNSFETSFGDSGGIFF